MAQTHHTLSVLVENRSLKAEIERLRTKITTREQPVADLVDRAHSTLRELFEDLVLAFNAPQRSDRRQEQLLWCSRMLEIRLWDAASPVNHGFARGLCSGCGRRTGRDRRRPIRATGVAQYGERQPIQRTHRL